MLFPCSKGSKAHDPLSLPFFCYCSRGFELNGEGGRKCRFFQVPTVAHLRFVDDTLIFCNTNEEQVSKSKM